MCIFFFFFVEYNALHVNVDINSIQICIYIKA